MIPARLLKVVLAGAGMISRFHLTAWQKLGDNAHVVAICDPDLARAKERAEEFGVPEIYPSLDAVLAVRNIDAIDIASPRATHVPLIELAAAKGIDVLCQKPLAPDLAQADALLRGVAGRIRIMAHENWRFRPWYRELKSWLDAGDVGEILSLAVSVRSSGLLPDDSGCRPALVRQPFMADEHRLMIAEDLIHHLDLVRWLAGPLRVVAARATRTHSDIKGETLATILLETGRGAPVTVSGILVAPGFPPRSQERLELIRRTSTVTFADARLHMMGHQERERVFDMDAGYQQSFDATIAHFVQSLASGTAFETDAVDNIETLRLVEYAYLAAGFSERRDFRPDRAR
jgi:predicted dehydrogenase